MRNELITTGIAMLYGLNSLQTLHKNQELDKLLNILGHKKEPKGLAKTGMKLDLGFLLYNFKL
ncbi:hypothetical protein [Peribacillus simplex]|uniref:hypothetical protein n=1 Tax=Peribacillus simplex TaxID=1478 RepID=UPI003D288125